MPPDAAIARRESTAHYEIAGASLLSQASANPPAVPARIDPTWQIYRGHLEARLAQLRNYRNSWIQHWAVLAKYLAPRRNIWLTQGATTQPVPNTMVRGRMINQAILDATGTLAMRICANGLMSGLTSPSRPWFKLKPGISMPASALDRSAQLWFDDTEETIYRVMAGSNFYTAVAQCDEDLVGYGTAPMIIYESVKNVIHCYNACAGEYMVAVGANMEPETLIRQFLMTISAVVEMFGLENCPPDIRGMWRDKGASLEVEKIVCHAIEPNFKVESRGGRSVGAGDIVSREYPWRECYWIWGSQGDKPLSVRGFYDPPHVVPRWDVQGNDAYGRSPGMDALPDIMQLQVMTTRMAEAIEKQVRPPLLADATLKNQPSSILPGHITYIQALTNENGMRPVYQVNPQIDHMAANIEKISARIKSTFFNDLFLMISQMDRANVTATEIDAKREEKLIQLGPVIERNQNEFLSPAIRRIFNICARKGLLKPLPPSLRGMPIQIEYISMLAIAQRAAATAGIERTMAMTGNLLGAWPELRFKVDPMEVIDEYADLLSVNKRMIRPTSEAMQMAQAAQQKMQGDVDQQKALQATTAGVDAAQTLSQTPVGGGASALQVMLGLANPQGSA